MQNLLELNWISTLSGISAVLFVAFLRLHWPFRFQYIASFCKRSPVWIMRWLDKSFHKNRSRVVALLDKSTREIMAGDYDLAEQFIAKGLTLCKERPSLFHQSMVHYLFYNLAAVYFYRGRYQDAINLAFRAFQQDKRMSNALGIIVCASARMGDIQGAWEAYRLLPRKKGMMELRLFCMAEINAATGEYANALQYLQKVRKSAYACAMHLNQQEIQKRMEEWTKALSQAG